MKLTTQDKEYIYINPKYVVAVYPDFEEGEPITSIEVVNSASPIGIIEPVEVVIALMASAGVVLEIKN